VATAVLEFAVASTLIVLLRGGRRRAFSTAAGVVSGLCVWVLAAVLGLSAVLRASHAGYDALRWVGGAYLIWIGLRSLLARGSALGEATALSAPPRPLLGTGYVAGVMTDLLNPKVGVFFVSFLPAFVPHGSNVGLATGTFGAVFIVETVVYFLVLIALADRVLAWLADARKRRQMDRATGLVFLGFGLRLATESL
jgi:threonine/homoserine/homoserine lactone efflux protein